MRKEKPDIEPQVKVEEMTEEQRVQLFRSAVANAANTYKVDMAVVVFDNMNIPINDHLTSMGGRIEIRYVLLGEEQEAPQEE